MEWWGNGTGTDLAEWTDGAGNKQQSTDGVTWVSVLTTAGLPITVADFATAAILPNSPVFGVATITNVALTSNVATITATNNYTTGDVVTIYGLTTTALNGTWTLTGATGSTFTFAFTHANIGSTGDSGTASNGKITAGSNTDLQIDGNTSGMLLNSIILVKNEAGGGGLSPQYNGLYKVTAGGSGAAKWVLTRIYPSISQAGTVLQTYQPAPALPSLAPLTVWVKNGQPTRGSSSSSLRRSDCRYDRPHLQAGHGSLMPNPVPAPVGLELQGVLNFLAGTIGLGEDAAACAAWGAINSHGAKAAAPAYPVTSSTRARSCTGCTRWSLPST